MQTSSFGLAQEVSGFRGRNRVVFAVLTVVAMLLAVLVPAQGAKAASVTATSISTVSPATGLTAGSTTVTITGANLTSVSVGVPNVTVMFGNSYGIIQSSPAPSASSITVKTPSGYGTVDVKVTTALGSVTMKNAFTYKSNNVSQVLAVSPTSGPSAGYNNVILTGLNLRSTTAVSFGTVPAVSFKIDSDTQITAVAPAGIANSMVLVNATNISGLQTTVATYKYSSTVCAPKTYRTTTFKYRSAVLTSAQKTAIRASVNEMLALGCDQMDLVKYKGSTKGASASYKAYIALSNKRADAVNNVVVKQLNYKGKSIKVNTIKRTTQISQSKKAVYDSYTSYRKVLLTVTRTDAIAGIYPAAGSVSGGNAVTITGTGFGAVEATGAIKFGSVASPSYVINAAGDTIVATVPAGTLGSATVSIQYGVSGTSTAKLVYGTYTYLNAPTTTAVTPSGGPVAGGNTVTITGTGFTGATGVSFGGVNAQSFTATPTSITAVAPANPAGSKTITITGAAGTTTISYDYVGAPTIATITPANGSRLGANTVTITGTGLIGATSSTVIFGNTPGTNVLVKASGTSMTVTAPARSSNGKANISITSAGGLAVITDAYAYGFAVTAISPTTGPTGAGQAVTLTGVDFPPSSDLNYPLVTFGAPTGSILTAPERATSVVRVSETSITAVAPAHVAATTSVRVYSDASTYVELASAYTFVAPTITSVSPSSRALGGDVTITVVGLGFGTILSSAVTKTVTVGGFPCANPTITIDNTTLTCVSAPSSSGAKDLIVTIAGNAFTAKEAITYLAAPTISSVTETAASGLAGATVVISGNGFVAGSSVTFGGIAANITNLTGTSITVTAPQHGAGAVAVVVTNVGGSATKADGFTYIVDPG